MSKYFPLSLVDGVRQHLKKYPALGSLRRFLSATIFERRQRDVTNLNVVQSFPLYVPYSAGGYDDRASCTIQSINQTIPNLAVLAKQLRSGCAQLRPITSFATIAADLESAEAIKRLFDQYGSDKANAHNYHFLYGPILRGMPASGILEIGLGTNNPGVVSTMGIAGKPGASLRAFRDFTNASIYGADVDKAILFDEHRIRTFFVDQTDARSFLSLGANLPDHLDLIIDDGLHSTNANLATLDFALPRVAVGGWVVIEDIGNSALPLWEVVSVLFPPNYECHLLEDTIGSVVFAVKRTF